MLNLPIAMKRLFAIFSLVMALFLGRGVITAAAQSYQLVRISTPQTGDVLQGQVSIQGTSQIDGFVSAEVEFSYSGADEAWYVIQASQQGVTEGELAVWDTTTITDGNYTVRLTVHLQDGRSMRYEVEELRVRNYTAVETATPNGSLPSDPATPTQPAVIRTPTPHPTVAANPAAVNPAQFMISLIQGAAVTLVLFFGFGLYFWLRRRFIGR